MTDLTGLPGAELVKQGLADLSLGRVSSEALTVSVASMRLRSLGLDVQLLPSSVVTPLGCELALHALLSAAGDPDPYARYNALIRELDSFLEAAEGRRRRTA